MRPRLSALALCVFVAMTICLTWPLVVHAGSAVEDLYDALLNTWILAWDGHQLVTDPLRLFDANIFYPYGNTLAFSETILPHALLALPFTLATGNPVFGYNVALLMALPLCGFAAYLLVLYLTGSRLAGMAAGVLYAFNAYMLSNIAQVQLLTLQWLPLALFYLDRTLRPARGPQTAAKKATTAGLLSLFVVLQALSSFYYAVLSAIAVALWLLMAVVVRREAPGRGGVVGVLLALAIASVVVLPFALPYAQVEHDLGFRRAIEESAPFSASLAQYAQALPGNLLYGPRLAAEQPVIIGGYPLDSLFPGFGALALAGIGLVWGHYRRQPWLFALLLGLVAFVLSLGPTLLLSPGIRADLPLPMPYRLLYALPGVPALRAPVRFAALVFLGLSILVGLGVAALAQRPRAGWPGTLRQLAGALCLSLLVAEAVTWPTVTITPVPTGDAVPAVYRWLAKQAPGVILELPLMASTPERGLLNQYFSTYHWHTTPDGYSGFIPPTHGQVVYEMASFPSERSLSLLQGLGVHYLVVHSDLIADWQNRAQRLEAMAGDMELVASFGSTLVYEIKPVARSGSLQAGLYLPPTSKPRVSYPLSLIVRNEGARSTVTKPTQRATVHVTWRANNAVVQSEERVVTLPLVVSETATLPVVVTAPAAGNYDVTVRVRLADGREVTESATVRVHSDALPPAQVAPVRLLSGAADRESYRAGDQVQVRLRWRALGKIDAYYSVFVRLLDKDGQAIAQVDGQPAQGSAPTLLWAPGDEIEDTWLLTLPATTPPGRHILEAGLYLPEDLSPRLTLDAGGRPLNRLLLGFVRVAPPLDLVGPPPLPLNVPIADKAALTGYDIQGCTWAASRCVIERGATLTVTLYWQAATDIIGDYTVFVHLADSSGKPVAQHDGRPRGGSYPTSVWQKGDVVADTHHVLVPEAIPAGDYRLLTGLYDLATGIRLPTGTPDDSILILGVAVE